MRGQGFLAEFLWPGTSDWSGWHSVPAALAVFRCIGLDRLRQHNAGLLDTAVRMLCQSWGSSTVLGMTLYTVHALRHQQTSCVQGLLPFVHCCPGLDSKQLGFATVTEAQVTGQVCISAQLRAGRCNKHVITQEAEQIWHDEHLDHHPIQ